MYILGGAGVECCGCEVGVDEADGEVALGFAQVAQAGAERVHLGLDVGLLGAVDFALGCDALDLGWGWSDVGWVHGGLAGGLMSDADEMLADSRPKKFRAIGVECVDGGVELMREFFRYPSCEHLRRCGGDGSTLHGFADSFHWA